MNRIEWRWLFIFYKKHDYIPDYASKYYEQICRCYYQRDDGMNVRRWLRQKPNSILYKVIVQGMRSTPNPIFK